MQGRHQKQMDSMARSKQKLEEDKTNDEFVKQLTIKLIIGPKDASLMALDILAKVLKMSQEEIGQCHRKIK